MFLHILAVLLYLDATILMAAEPLIIDDRRTGSLNSTLGPLR